MNKIDPQILLRRAAVQPPYFAFGDIWSIEDGLTASVVPEHQMEDEIGPIAAAEAGRHLAILGSCAAAAIADDTKLYYLATRVVLQRTEFWPGTGDPLFAATTITERSRRGLTAHATLYSGEPIYWMDCFYSVLPAKIFERLFEQYRVPYPEDIPGTPYRFPVALDSITSLPDGLSATCGPLPAGACAGHFPEFPAWPVALVMHCISRLAGRALQQHVGRQCSYSVVHADVVAEHLAFAVDKLWLRALHISSDGDMHTFDCLATNAEKTIGAVTVTMVVL